MDCFPAGHSNPLERLYFGDPALLVSEAHLPKKYTKPFVPNHGGMCHI
jgi:hypothetical protein